jgi:hypothetical protein
MCLPPLILAGAALALGGAGLQYAGQQKADHAKLSAFNRERTRQHGFEQDQVAKFQDSLNSVGNLGSKDAQDAAAANRLSAFKAVTQDANPAATGYLPSTPSAPKIVADEGAQVGAKENATTGSLSQALANLGGFSDLKLGTDTAIGRNSQAIAQTGGFMRGSLDALQPEMDAAKQKGSGLRTLGSLAQSIGGAMLSGGMGGGGISAPDTNALVPFLSIPSSTHAMGSLPVNWAI